MKTILLTVLLSAVFSSCAQVPEVSRDNPNDPNNFKMYVGGYLIKKDQYGYLQNYAGYWVDGKWVLLADKNAMYSRVLSLAAKKKDVYAGGFLWNGSETQGGYWLNGDWNSMAKPIVDLDNNGTTDITTTVIINAVLVHNNDVYTGGYCRMYNYDCGMIWKNGEPLMLSSWASSVNATVSSLVYLDGFIYAGGNNNGIGGYWKIHDDNDTFQWFGFDLTGSGYSSSFVATLAVSGGDIYAAGGKTNPTSGGISESACYWKINSGRIDINPLFPGLKTYLNGIIIDGTDVKVSGSQHLDGVAIPGIWVGNDLVWNSNETISPWGGWMHTIVKHGQDIYACGQNTYVYNVADPENDLFIAGYWKNGSWEKLCDENSDALALMFVDE